MYIPFIGRLSLTEWPVLVLSFLATYLEFVISIVTKLLPDVVVEAVTSTLKGLHGLLFKRRGETSRATLNGMKIRDQVEFIELRDNIRNTQSIVEIGKLFGYDIDNHIVETEDGYLLNLHRIKPKQLDGSAPVVYLHHGLLMCSDIWCVNIKKDRNIPFLLHELGFDVWMGNNRGNKYSSKHIHLKPNDVEFWDFAIDEFAIYDIPDSIRYALQYTGAKDLTYIGFSQGSAQAFAALSMNPTLNSKINLFIALSPAMTPNGLHHRVVDTLIKSSPSIMYLIFGKKTLLPTASFWQQICYPPLFSKVIDYCVAFLFNWQNENITFDQKIASFAHLYSPTSVKSVVHWFQIIRNSSFQMFDEGVSLTNALSKAFRTPSFPTRTNIKVPIKLIYGTIDSLVDINKMTDLLPEGLTECVAVPNHEHLDLIWGDHIEELVFPHILRFLNVPESNDVELIEENEKVTVNGHSSP
ncbi:TGL1 [Cyberlindnera jadinii]|uniref:Alpha/beta-hydrolase n=1 Tax=Cyberlindnera jadinii (strain ATCC 18201 / CBS 1600 / BCRC 20928 / JCM 3617 / NBRC 0987 / NRRL Y-1542) TaxID=983966 RepID=A0A0H5C304_CYBJN|nr:alpha/beta-hydrolase [Cyberlindnera jadinii NRRL Y-1542]ODV72741.1 alpha/beta-hydrolase [Cyberlindnera jadinii NRRL Y-1542]CEP22233.1 TGL1 [Cyberlindnera jadinii]